MTNDKPSEDLRTKLLLLFLDKLFLGVVVAILAYLFNVNLQQQEKVLDYQKTLFDRRVGAYLDVLQKAGTATDELASHWGDREKPGWSARLSMLADRWTRFVDRGSRFSSSGFGASFPEAVPFLLKNIEAVEVAWTSNSVYFSKPVSDAVNGFLDTVSKDLDAEVTLYEGLKETKDAGKPEPAAKFDDQHAWERAKQAYQRLNDLIRDRLKLDGIIVG
jgi:hypothetical protein